MKDQKTNNPIGKLTWEEFQKLFPDQTKEYENLKRKDAKEYFDKHKPMLNKLFVKKRNQ